MPPPTSKKHPLDEFLPPITKAVFAHEDARQSLIKNDLLTRNQEAGGSPAGFICAGRKVSHLDPKELRYMSISSVLPELHNEALMYVEAANKLDDDHRRLTQYAGSLFRRCRGIQDIRNLLPDMLAAEIPVFRGLSRTADMQFLLKDNAMLQTPYQGFQDTIGYYLANRLIY